MVIIEQVSEFLKKYDLQDKTLIVGFSGGYDSMCLLDALSKIKNMDGFFDLNIIAAHFNHNWRGAESRKEQEICRLFATSKGFEFYTQTAQKLIRKTENDARIARYEFFEDARDLYDAVGVLTAHNKDDNAETVMYRVVKGTGIVGLKGIAKHRDIYYRPLLKISRQDILKYCEENNLLPNNDSSNSDTTYKRNYIRLSVLPALEKINPNVKDALNTLSEVARNEDELIEEYLSMFRDKVIVGDRICPQEYKKLSKQVKMRFIYEYIQQFLSSYDYKKISELYDFIEQKIDCKNGSTISLASAKWLYVDNKTIETIPSDKDNVINNVCIDISGEGKYNVNGKTFVIKPYDEEKLFVFPEETASFVYVDLSNIEFPLKLRTRQEGDMINPFGMSGSMKLKKFLNSKGVSRHTRDSVLLLANDNEVLWAVGVGLSNKIAVKEKPTHVIECP